jgi:hypothetical protein
VGSHVTWARARTPMTIDATAAALKMNT